MAQAHHGDSARRSLSDPLDNLSGELIRGAGCGADLRDHEAIGSWANLASTFPARNIWAATGNNFGLSTEQVRRAIPIFLIPGEIRHQTVSVAPSASTDLLGWGTAISAAPG